VIAIEADAESFALLRQNLVSLGLQSRVTAHLGLAGGCDARYRRVRVDRHTSATYFLPDAEGAAMPAIVLDDLQDRSEPRRRVAVIKIDVEGMELAVLRSAERTIGRDRPVLYVEISIAQMARYRITLPEVAAFLTPMIIVAFVTSATEIPPMTHSSWWSWATSMKAANSTISWPCPPIGPPHSRRWRLSRSANA